MPVSPSINPAQRPHGLTQFEASMDVSQPYSGSWIDTWPSRGKNAEAVELNISTCGLRQTQAFSRLHPLISKAAYYGYHPIKTECPGY